MCSYKADVHKSNCKLYYCNYSIGVSFNIEYIPLISYAIHSVEGLFHICEARPVAIFHNICPYLQWKQRIGV